MGKRRVGEDGKDRKRRGIQVNACDERGHGGRGGKGKEEGEGNGGVRIQPPNFNSWRRHVACCTGEFRS